MALRHSIRFLLSAFAVVFVASELLADGRVVIYTSVDDPYARPIIRRFQDQTGIEVVLVTDAEATKTAGLVERLLAEKSNPHADVYWGNEIFHTINLAEGGVLAAYRSPVAEGVPDRWRDKNDLYVAIGLRARVIGISTRPENKLIVEQIKGLHDLTNPALKGRIGVCHPGFGTASGHFAAMYVLWGEQKYKQFLQGLRANEVKLLGGNSVVAEQVAAGALIAGPTDNDDVNNAKAEGLKIDGVVPDQREGEWGTLLIPTTVSLVNGAPNPDNARKLIDFLLAPEIEKELIEGRYLAYSVRDAGEHVKAMDVDYVEAAHQMRQAIELALGILQDRATAPR